MERDTTFCCYIMIIAVMNANDIIWSMRLALLHNIQFALNGEHAYTAYNMNTRMHFTMLAEKDQIIIVRTPARRMHRASYNCAHSFMPASFAAAWRTN